MKVLPRPRIYALWNEITRSGIEPAINPLTLPGLASRFQRSGEIAFAAALLWAVHPLQTTAVTYIVQRMTSMATLFFLLSLLCYVKARITKNDSRKIILFAAATLLGAMALFSKENSGMLPVMILGYELFFLPRPGQEKKNRKTLLILTGGALVAFFLICWLFLGNDPLARVLHGYEGRGFTLGQRLLTETRIVLHYLSANSVRSQHLYPTRYLNDQMFLFLQVLLRVLHRKLVNAHHQDLHRGIYLLQSVRFLHLNQLVIQFLYCITQYLLHF